MIERAVIFIMFLIAGLTGIAQNRCGTPPQPFLDKQNFENWMQVKRFEKSVQTGVHQRQAEIYLLPVVVHVIHNGENLGDGGNLSDAKIQKQIDILNEDFRRMNADTVNTPSTFQPVAADIEVEFVLAKQDPNGDLTNGIVRKQGAQLDYSYSQDEVLKTESYWPAEDYINIWVAQVEFLGWASFPETSLSGIPNHETNRLFDGIVVDADWWAINNNTGGFFDSFGQTATHEIGHFLGLRHIWGDGNCSASDFCNDTPPAFGHFYGVGSPCTQVFNSCDNDIEMGASMDFPDMFMNYMDYTNDECMNLFTLDQKMRMRTVLENSPRRLSLRTSHALDEPIVILPGLDLAIGDIVNVPLITCNTQISPSITLNNFGLNEITSFKLAYSVDGVETLINESNVSITTGASYDLTIDISGLSVGSNQITWEIKEVNGTTDKDASNNLSSSNLDVQLETFQTPFKEGFSINFWNAAPIQISEWSTMSINSNEAATVAAFENNTAVESWLVSPVFDLSDFEEAGLFFSMSYGIRFGFPDALEVKISSACSDDFVTIWSNDLNTISFPNSFTEWTPSLAEDWLNQFIDLDDYVGFSEVRLAFVFFNNGGNNFYLDDIELTNNSDPNQPRLPAGTFIAYPNPAQQSFNITLSLPETQPIRVEIIDMSGAVVTDLRYENVINQTFSIQIPNKYGMYFLRISGKDINQTQRILINR